MNKNNNTEISLDDYFYLNIISNRRHLGNKMLFEKVFNQAIIDGLNIVIDIENSVNNRFI